MDQQDEPLRETLVELLPRLRRFARALARDPHDADDLVQQALERALSRADQLRPGSSAASWLFGIVRHAFLDEARARSRRLRRESSPELAEEIADPATPAPGTLEVQDAMAHLPEEQRSAVALVLIEGLSYREAAQAMGVPMGTLTSRLARGREALQRLLGDADGAAR